MIWSVCKRCRKRFTARSENWLWRQCDEYSNEVYLGSECRFEEPCCGLLFSVSVFMLLPLFDNDFVLAKVLSKCTGINNTTTMVAIANANAVHALRLFVMLLMYWFTFVLLVLPSNLIKTIVVYCYVATSMCYTAV